MRRVIFLALAVVLLLSVSVMASEPITEPNCYGYQVHDIEVRVYSTSEGEYFTHDFWLKRKLTHGAEYLGLPPGSTVTAAWRGVDNPKGWCYTATLGNLKLTVPVELLNKEHPELKKLEGNYGRFFIMVMYTGCYQTEIHILSYPTDGRILFEDAMEMYWAMDPSL